MRDTQKRVVTYFLVVMSVVILLLTVTACKEKGTDIPPEKMLSSDLDSLMFSLDGVIYTFPVHYSELEANGWMPHDPDNRFATDTLEQGGDDRWELMHGNQNISVTLANLSENVVSFRDSYITDVLVLVRENVPVNYNASLILPGNIQIGSTSEEVFTAYGEDATILISEESSTISFMYSSEIFYLNIIADTSLNSVFLMYYVYSQNTHTNPQPTQVPLDSKQNPEPLRTVKGLSNDLESLMFSIDDVVYTLPVHFSELEAKGWTFYEDNNAFPNVQHSQTSMLKPGMLSFWWRLTDGDRIIEVNFKNLSNEELPVNRSYITDISSSETPIGEQIVFPGGIVVGVAYEEVLSLYGEPTEVINRTNEDVRRIIYQRGNVNLSLRVCKHSNLVSFIGLGVLGR